MANEINPPDLLDERELDMMPGTAPSGVKRRLLLGVGSMALGPLGTLILQVVNVPIFLRFWGPELYGEWLLLSAIPTYLAMSDMGFGAVAGTDMTMRAARGDFEGALVTFQSTWKLVTLVSAAMAVLAVPVLLLLPLDSWLKLEQISLLSERLVLMILAVDSLACLQTSFAVCAFKANGKNHVANVCVSCMRLVEGTGVLLSIVMGRGPVFVAMVLLVVRSLSNLGLMLLALRTVPWLRFGLKYATTEKVKELFRPALAFMAFPAGTSLNLQGTVLAIGIVLGPGAVAVFSPLRTLSRTAAQLTEIFKMGAWAEVSAAYGTRNLQLARKLHRFICQASLWLSGCFAVMLAVVGPWVLRVWTHGRIFIDLPTFHFLLLGVVVNALWNASSIVPIAANQHSRIALEQLAVAALSLGLVVVLLHTMGLPGAGLGLLLGDFLMIAIVLPLSARLLNDNLRDFSKSLFDPRAILSQVARLRSRARS